LEHSAESESLVQQLTSVGVQTVLVSDDSEFEKLPFGQDFSERVAVPRVGLRSAGTSVGDTQVAHTLAAAMDSLEQLRSPYLLWLHLQGMAGEWDAPREFRERFADEEDPPPPDFVQPPDRLLPQDVDPDEILGVNQAFAGQVAMIDDCLGTWLEAISKREDSNETLLIVTAPRGYPLGERGGFGASTDGLHEEVLHVPLLMRLPNGQRAMQRSQALVYPSDMNPTLRHWFRVPDESAATTKKDLLHQLERRDLQREFVVSAFHDARSIRTPAWFVTHVGDKPAQCFVKPDDRWEVNQLSDRRSDIVEQGLLALRAFEQAASQRKLDELPKLPAVLIEAPE
jgi:arylsulfatase A-like enzyme